MGLLESLAEDIRAAQAANINLEGETDDGESNKDAGNGDGGNGDGGSRSRLNARRSTRNNGASSQNEDGAPQKDEGASRGSRGNPQGPGEGASSDARASQGDAPAPQGGEGDGVLDDAAEPKTKTAWVEHRAKLREAEVKARTLQQKLDELQKGGTAQPPADKTVQAPATPQGSEKKLTLADIGAEPDKDKDLAGWLVWDAQARRIELNEFKERAAAQDRQAKLNEGVAQAVRHTNSLIDSYKKENPDFENAYTHGRQAYKNGLKMLDPNATDQQIENKIKWEEIQLAIKCEKEGTKLGDVMYDMAITRFGYDPDAAPGEGTGARQPGAGTPPAPRPNLRVISNNKRRSASPMEGGGQRAPGRITLERAADMTMEELQNLPAEDWAWLKTQGF